MELFSYNGFQTVEFSLMVVLTGWILSGKDVGRSFLWFWCFLGLSGLVALNAWGSRFPALPFFVSFWRMMVTVAGALLLNAYRTEWRSSPGGLGPAHALGMLLSVVGVSLVWLANWEVSSATTLMVAFILLGYCVRENRL